MAPKLLNILLQRNDRNVQWGFRLSGGKDLAKPLTIVKVSPGTLAAQYLVPGDIVLNIQGYETKNLLHLEAVELVRDPGKSLELVIQKTDTPLSSNEDLPASIWGPEHVLQRPSEWIRRSPSPCMNQYFQPIAPKPSVYQRSVSVGSGYSEPSTSAIPMSPVLQTPSDWLRQSPTSFSTVFSEPTSPTEPIIQAPSPWMRRAPSPSPAVFHDHKPTKPTGYRNASSLRQHFEAVNQEAMQQESTFRTGYTPTSLDNKIKKKFETFGTESGFQKLNSVTEENFRPLFNPPARNWRASSEPCQKPFEAQKSYDASNVSYFSETKQYGHYQGSKFQAEMSKDVFKPQGNVRMYSRLSPTPVQEIIGPNRHQIQVQYEVQFGIQKQTQDRSYEHEIYQQQMKQREMEKEFQLKQQQQMQQQIQKQQQEQLRQQQQQEQLKQEQQQKLIQQQQLQQQQLLQQERLQQLQQHKVGAHYQTEKTKGQVQKANTISTTIVRSSREQFSASSVEVNKNIPSTEKPKIPSTADILKRPISPEFNMVPNSRSNSLLKHVLSKSLGSYSPADFEKMKAYENEQSDNEDDDEGDDSSTETDDDEDDDDDSTEAETEVETQDDDACSSCQPSVYDSGSVIFERFWGSENEDNDCADDNEVMQHCGNSPFVELSTDTSCSTVASRRDTPTSISRNSSAASNYSRPDTPIVTEDLVDEYDRLRRSSSNVSSRPGTPVAQHSSRSSRCSSAASVDSRPGTPYTPLSRSSSTSSIPSRPGTPTVTDNLGGRQSSQISGGGNTLSPGPPSEGDGVTNNSAPPTFAAPPPPPPPPPSASGPLPTVRLSTEIPDSRKGGGYEPPAAIQNAMLTKDKKPFTYTPGGLDLSQIRSPRMQRRITRNANAEGVGEHPQAAVAKTSPLAQPPPQGPLPPSALAAMQPQMAVPVFPTGGVPQLHHVTTPPGSHNAPAPPPPPPPPSGPVFPEPSSVPQPLISNAVPKTTPPVIRPVQSPAPPPKLESSIPTPTVVKSQPMSPPTTIHNEPGSIYVPPVTTRSQVGSLYIPPLTDNTQQDSVTSPPLRQQTPQTASPMSPLPTLNKAPTPWMSQHQRQQQQQNVPSWVNREEPQQPTGTTRIIPIQVEGRNDSAPPPQPHYQAPVSMPQYQPPQPVSNQPHTRIVPIQIEGSGSSIANSAPKQQSPSHQQRMPVYVHNKFNPSNSPQTPPSPAPYNHSVGNDNQPEQNPRQYQHQQSWGQTGGNGGQQNWGPPGGNGGPIQSRSFRVLQKITDTDQSEGESDVPAQEYGPPSSGGGQWNNQGIPVQQIRKLQLSEDDRALMNKFRAQVDEDSFLHTESDPRYRGAAIPSKAFRMLQNMTDGTGDYSEQVPRGPAVSRGPQTRPVSVQQSPSVDGAAPQPYIPPSEQQVPEPRKYTGGAIPSRSFRMLQAMTAPENCGPGQSDM